MACALLKAFTATIALLPLSAIAARIQSYNGLAITPAMGWDNWNAFDCKINEELLLNTAQKIVDYGLRDLGMFSSTASTFSHADECPSIRILLHYPRRLLVGWQVLQWHAEA